MADQTTLSSAALERLRAYDTCTISNAIERLRARLRNEGFISGVARCQFPEFQPIVGYAATARIRTTSAPIRFGCYHDRMDWWNYVASLPEPRIMVLQDADRNPAFGAFVGQLHVAIGVALNCIGCVTNGAVRDLPAIEAMGFQLFAGRTCVSHAYAHIAEFGEPVEIDGLKISSGDLLHGDRHGVLTIPLSVAASVPEEAAKVLQEEGEFIQFCRSSRFTLEALSERLRRMNISADLPWPDR